MTGLEPFNNGDGQPGKHGQKPWIRDFPEAGIPKIITLAWCVRQ